MLRSFSEEAAARGVAHATGILRSWADDWSDVPVCDVVVASRATAVPDLEAAVKKLVSHARRRVYLTYPAHGRFVGDEIARRLGRSHHPLPDYLHVLGILHHLEIHPALEFLSDASRFAGVTDADVFVSRVGAFVEDLTAAEVAIVCAYFDSHRNQLDRERMRWALLSWDVSHTA